MECKNETCYMLYYERSKQEFIRHKGKFEKRIDPILKELSNQRIKIKVDIGACQNHEKKKQKIAERKTITAKLQQRIKHIECYKFKGKLLKTKQMKDVSLRHFEGIKEFNRQQVQTSK